MPSLYPKNITINLKYPDYALIVLNASIASLLFFITSQEIMAQNSESSKANHSDINLQTIVISGLGIAGAIISAIVVNKFNIVKDQIGRQADAIRDKLNLLSMITYHLRNTANYILQTDEKLDNNKVMGKIREIDDIIRGKLYLLNPDSVKELTEIRIDLELGNLAYLAPVTRIYDLVQLLQEEYNKTTIRYKDIVKEALQEIKFEELHYEITDEFKQGDDPFHFITKIRVYGKENKNIERAVIKGEIKKPTGEIERRTWLCNPKGICILEVYAYEIGNYTVTCKVYADGYETQSFTTSFEKR